MKLQVREADVERAIEVLERSGLLKQETKERSRQQNKVLLVLSLVIIIIFLYYFLKTVPAFTK